MRCRGSVDFEQTIGCMTCKLGELYKDFTSPRGLPMLAQRAAIPLHVY